MGLASGQVALSLRVLEMKDKSRSRPAAFPVGPHAANEIFRLRFVRKVRRHPGAICATPHVRSLRSE